MAHVAYARFGQTLQTWTAMVNKRRNSFLSISQIPLEVFTQILRLVLDDAAPLRQGLWGVRWTMASVSSRWRDVILSTPMLWAHINMKETVHQIRITLQRSANSPLDILQSRIEQWTEEEERARRSIFEELQRQSQRWRSLDTVFLSPVLTLEQQLQEQLPHLQIVKLRPNGDLRKGETRTFAFAGGPQLRQLFLSAIVPETWANTSPFSTLRQLILRDLSSNIPTADCIISILRAAQQLEKLYLLYFRGVPNGLVWPEDLPAPETYPNLKALTLAGIGTITTYILLRRIHAPQLSTLQISAHSRDLSPLLGALTRAFNTVAHSLSIPSCINLSIDGESSVSIFDGSPLRPVPSRIETQLWVRLAGDISLFNHDTFQDVVKGIPRSTAFTSRHARGNCLLTVIPNLAHMRLYVPTEQELEKAYLSAPRTCPVLQCQGGDLQNLKKVVKRLRSRYPGGPEVVLSLRTSNDP